MSDLSSRQFGDLTVIRPLGREKHGFMRYECRCKCGKIVESTSNRLLYGGHKSCGCSRRLKLEGQKFGRLTVIRLIGIDKKMNNTLWECKCDCGKTTKVHGTHLKRGKILSCGCLLHEALVKAHTKYTNPDDKRLAMIFSGMKDRCYNKNLSYYNGTELEESISATSGLKTYGISSIGLNLTDMLPVCQSIV